MKFTRTPMLAMAFVLPLSAHAVILVQARDPSFYNNNIGTLTNSANGGETG